MLADSIVRISQNAPQRKLTRDAHKTRYFNNAQVLDARNVTSDDFTDNRFLVTPKISVYQHLSCFARLAYRPEGRAVDFKITFMQIVYALALRDVYTLSFLHVNSVSYICSIELCKLYYGI